MKKVILLSAALLAMTAVAANAQLNLAIGDCGGPQDVSWTCTTNSGTAFTAVASFIAPALQTLTGEEGTIDISFANPVPAWWKIGTGQCRLSSALGFSLAVPGGGGCAVDYFGSVGDLPAGGVFYTVGPGSDGAGPLDANTTRIRTVSAVNGDQALVAQQPGVGDEVFLFTIAMNKSRSTGTGSCAGCAEPACMVFKKLVLTQPAGVGDVVYQIPSSFGFVTLQTGAGTNCPTVTPTSRSSWGQVKSLYR